MSRQFLTNLNLNKNELQNAAIQALGIAPSNPVVGQIYFDTDLNHLRQWDGSQWLEYLTAESGAGYITSVGANLDVTDQELTLGANVIITDSTQTLTNKTYSAPTLKGDVTFTNSSDTEILKVTQTGVGTVRINATDDLSLRSTAGDIILYPGNEVGGIGKVYIGWGNADPDTAYGVAGADNEVATVGDTQTFTNKTVEDPILKDYVSFTDNSDVERMSIDYSGTGATRIISQDDLSIRSQDGDIILYPGSNNQWGGDGGTGKAYVNWGNDATGAAPQNEITTAGNTQVLDNKTIGAGGLLFDDGTDQYGSITKDTGKNLVIDGTYNDVIITSDSGYAYIGNNDTDATRIVIKSDLTALQAGLAWKQAVNVHLDATEAADLEVSVSGTYPSEILTSTLIGGLLVIDGHTIDNADAGYRILVTGTNSTKDGIWVLQSVAELNWTAVRATDADVFGELIGAAVFVMEGTTYAATSWVQSDHYITDFTGQDWVQFSGQGTYVAGDGITIDGQEILVHLDSDSLASSASGLKVNLNATSGLGIDEGLFVNTGTGIIINESNQVAIDTANGYGIRKHAENNLLLQPTSNVVSWVVSHGLSTRDVTVQVYENNTYTQVEVDVAHTNTSAVTLTWVATANVAANAYRVVVVG